MGKVKKPAGPAKPDLASFMALCPSELGPVAKKEWERIVPELIERDLLKPLDRALVAVYCTANANWLAANEALEKFGAVIRHHQGIRCSLRTLRLPIIKPRSSCDAQLSFVCRRPVASSTFR